MKPPLAQVLTLGLTALLALGAVDQAFGRKKQRSHRTAAASVTRDLGVVRDLDGTPIIMQGYRSRGVAPEIDLPAQQRAERPLAVRRGSSTYIPQPNPSPDRGPPASSLLQPPPPAYKPPAINTFSDRVTNCIHSFPLNGGLGNNPVNQQAYIGQCAN